MVEQAVHQLRQEDAQGDVQDVVLELQVEVDLRQFQATGFDVVVHQVARDLALVPLDSHAAERDAGDDFESREDVLEVSDCVVPLPPEDERVIELLLRIVVLEAGIQL